MTSDGHGTYAAYQRHRRTGEDACQACKDAGAAYARAHRKANPAVYRRELADKAARERALRRLAARHPRQFRELYQDELNKDERTRT